MEPLPTCEELSCTHLPYSNVNLTATNCSGTASQSTCDIMCNEGYTAAPDHYATCVRGGWVGNVACEPNPCLDDLPFVAFMNRTASTTSCNSTSSNSTCDIVCSEGYTRSGTLSCLTGSWVENSLPTCNADCATNPPIRFLNDSSTTCLETASGSQCRNATCLRSPSAYYSYVNPRNVEYSAVVDLINSAIPSPHYIDWELSSSFPDRLVDGGGDMYNDGYMLSWYSVGLNDVGDPIHWKRGSTSSTTEININNGAEFHADYVYQSADQTINNMCDEYFTYLRGSSMVWEMTVMHQGTLSIKGGLGAQGVGTVEFRTYASSSWRGFRKSFKNTNDATINYLTLVSDPGANAGTTSFASPFNNLYNEIRYIGPIQAGTRVIHILYSTTYDYFMSDAEHQHIFDVATTTIDGDLFCYNGTYVVGDPNDDDTSSYVDVETYENTVQLMCTPDSCDSEPVIANYSGSGCAGTSSNETCGIVCDAGYHEENGPASCYAGVWTLPTCEEDPCPDVPSSILNLNVTASSSCAHTFSQSHCDVVCDAGYTVSSPRMTCIRGEWIGNATCVPNPCDSIPPVEYINSSASAGCLHTPSGDSCNVICIEGYTTANTNSVTCELGVWNENVGSTFPWCALDCSTYPQIDHVNTSVTNCGDSSHLTTCDFVCDDGYTHTGSSTCRNGTCFPPLFSLLFFLFYFILFIAIFSSFLNCTLFFSISLSHTHTHNSLLSHTKVRGMMMRDVT